MGVPYHTSRDVPGRCLWLIDRLYSRVEKIRDPYAPELGPLDATFLFAMSTLMLTLPLERIERHRRKEEAGNQGYNDDRPLDPAAAQEVGSVLGDDPPPLSASPFYVPGAWRFAEIDYVQGMNLAVEFPQALERQLEDPSAEEIAKNMSTKVWIDCIRNALAHGGIHYLDADGRQAFGQPAKMMGFVSARYPKGGLRNPPEKLLALRTTPALYRETLKRWVVWVQETGLSPQIAA